MAVAGHPLRATTLHAREPATLDSTNHLPAREGGTVSYRGPLFRVLLR